MMVRLSKQIVQPSSASKYKLDFALMFQTVNLGLKFKRICFSREASPHKLTTFPASNTNPGVNG